MKNNTRLRFWTLLAITPFSLMMLAQKNITVEDIWSNQSFETKTVPGFRFQNDGQHFTRQNGAKIETYDLKTGEKSALLFDAAALPEHAAPGWTGKFDNYAFSADESKILLAVDEEKIYRHSTRAVYFVFDLKTKKISRLYEGPKQRYACFSPDGSMVAYLLENDLYYKNLNSGKTIRVTADGEKNAIINGASDWVYEEEFALTRAFEWSPNSQKIAFLRFDERAVQEFTLDMYRGGDYPEQVTFKYPKVGEKNAVVTAHIFDLVSQKTIPVLTTAAMTADESDTIAEYLPRIAWTPGNLLCLTRMNRHQNRLQLLLADPATGICRQLLQETSPAYLELQEPRFLADGSGFVWQSETSGFRHLYRYDMQCRLKATLTKGDWEVTDFYGVDEKNGVVYFQAAAENPMQREIYSVQLNGKSRTKISDRAGVHEAQFSGTYDFFIDTWSTRNSPPQISVRDRAGQLVRQLENNAMLSDLQAECGVLPVEFFSVPAPGAGIPGDTLNAWMIRPSAPRFQGKKLPVLMYLYGGPGSQEVTDAWKDAKYWWFQMLAQQGYIVACVDNRGTGGRGEAFKKTTYLNLGKYETEDQIAAARYLGTLPFVDARRIGIFGKSYGGYMASLCLLKGGEVFKTGIALAPVTHWKWYDNVYTERYMRTEAENPEGYSDGAPVNFADKLKGKYLLVHGLADDNVHFQHSAEMSKQLIAANKQYSAMFYPNLNHSLSGGNASLHLYTLMTQFLEENLKGEGPVKRP